MQAASPARGLVPPADGLLAPPLQAGPATGGSGALAQPAPAFAHPHGPAVAAPGANLLPGMRQESIGGVLGGVDALMLLIRGTTEPTARPRAPAAPAAKKS